MVSAIRLFTASLLFGAAALAAPSRPRHVPKNAHEEGFVLRATRRDGFAATRSSSMSKRAVAKRCASRSSTSSLSSPTTAPGGVGALPTGTTTTTSYTTSTTVDSGNGGGDGGGNDQKPANWPTKTQSGPMYSATVASPSDPYLRSISEALNFDSVEDYHKTHSGDMTYYMTGQTSCGDYYTDDTFTAAVSHKLYNDWPQSDGPTDRAAICGPYVPGRQIINSEGKYTSVLSSPVGTIIIGGDGLANCQSAVGLKGQCHIALTATITNPANGKSAVVKIVDKCEDCERGDIDVTPAVFDYLSERDLGRVAVTWKFNHF